MLVLLKTLHEINEMNSFFPNLIATFIMLDHSLKLYLISDKYWGEALDSNASHNFKKFVKDGFLHTMKAFLINFLLQIKLYEYPQGKGCSQEQQTQNKFIYCFHVYSTLKCVIPPSLW
jgi:hypothetical protein